MRVMIYGIGGEFNERLVGCAHDATTGLSLLRLLSWTGSWACSLHGEGLDTMCALSGEVTVDQAVVMFTRALCRLEAERLKEPV